MSCTEWCAWADAGPTVPPYSSPPGRSRAHPAHSPAAPGAGNGEAPPPRDSAGRVCLPMGGDAIKWCCPVGA